MACQIVSYHIIPYRCLWKNTPLEKNMLRKTSLVSAKSGAGEQFPTLDCRARARLKGVFFSQMPVSQTPVIICFIYKRMCKVVAGKSDGGSFSPHWYPTVSYRGPSRPAVLRGESAPGATKAGRRNSRQPTTAEHSVWDLSSWSTSIIIINNI